MEWSNLIHLLIGKTWYYKMLISTSWFDIFGFLRTTLRQAWLPEYNNDSKTLLANSDIWKLH